MITADLQITAPLHRVVAKGRGATGPCQKTHEAECSDITWFSGRHRVQKLSRARPVLQGRPRCPRQPRCHLQRADLRCAGSAKLPRNPPPSRTPATSPLLGKHTAKAQFRRQQEATAAALLLVLLSRHTNQKKRSPASVEEAEGVTPHPAVLLQRNPAHYGAQMVICCLISSRGQEFFTMKSSDGWLEMSPVFP